MDALPSTLSEMGLVGCIAVRDDLLVSLASKCGAWLEKVSLVLFLVSCCVCLFVFRPNLGHASGWVQVGDRCEYQGYGHSLQGSENVVHQGHGNL